MPESAAAEPFVRSARPLADGDLDESGRLTGSEDDPMD
jgi:hypothetical protein